MLLCFMRSMITKLNSRGQKGPKSLKPFEVAYLLGQLEDSKFSWRKNALGVEPLIEKTLNVLQMQKEDHGENHEALRLICSKCGESSGVLQKNPINVDAENFSHSVSMVQIMSKCFKKPLRCSCKQEDSHDVTLTDESKLIVISFSNPINIEIPKSIFL